MFLVAWCFASCWLVSGLFIVWLFVFGLGIGGMWLIVLVYSNYFKLNKVTILLV